MLKENDVAVNVVADVDNALLVISYHWDQSIVAEVSGVKFKKKSG